MPEALTESLVWSLLEEVKDPEIPVVSVVEMGIIRQVEVHGDTVQVTMTPTFSGCPALKMMEEAVKERLQQAGARKVDVRMSNRPPWTSDWITPQAREKLKAFGLAPPPPVNGSYLGLDELDVVTCPYCGSSDTVLKNGFGPTLCRAIYYCKNCQQPFEQFKPV